MHRITSRLALLISGIVLLAGAARGQCVLQASAGLPQPQLSGFALCSTVWDPDGAGPLVQQLVVGGQDLTTGDLFDHTVMTWDGTTWAPLGAPGPLTAFVESLVVWNGQLVAGGWNSGGPHHVMVWNGAAWQPLGGPFTQGISELTVWNGNLVAVEAGTFPTFAIHRWDGSTWTTLPAPPTLQKVMSVVAYQGLLCVGGANTNFTLGVLERWNGTSWLPSITATSYITSLAVRPASFIGGADTLYAAGAFSSIGGTAAANIAATSGGTPFTWLALGTGLPTLCSALAVRNNGLLGGEVVASTFGSGLSGPVFKYSAVGIGGNPSWTAMGSAYLGSIRFYAGSYYGTRLTTGNAACVRYQGSAWVDVTSPGLDGQVHAVTPSGADVIVGGTFQTDGTAVLNGIARWDGTALTPLGGGITGTSVDALLTLGNGDVVVGGLFSAAGSTGALNIARWSGSAWSNFGLGINDQVLALAQLPNGDVIAGGRFTIAGGVPCARIARWNGTAWSPLGAGMNGDVHALAVRSDGVLFAGGAFTSPGNRIAQWNGSIWSVVGFGCNGDVHGLAVRPNGDVVAVGAFTTAGGLPAARCARWTATGWSAMGAVGSDPVAPRAVLALPTGDVLAGRGFHGGSSPDSGISRWNGTSWSSVGLAFAAADSNQSVSIRGLALRQNGEVVAVGTFNTAGNAVAFRVANLASNCPATATAYGAGCSSAAGPLVMTADTLPWIGTTLQTTTTGVTPFSLCIGITGFAQVSIPLPALIPAGQPGCSQLSSIDLVTILVAGPSGAVASQLALGNNPALIGARFFQQTIPLEFDTAGTLVAVRGSNALALVIGRL